MTRERAIRLSERWSEEGVCTLRDGEAKEYHAMCLAALREQEEYEGLKNSYDQLQASFDIIFESNQKMGEAFRLLLNEQEERIKGCPYCLYLEPLCRPDGDIIAIETDGKRYVIEGDYWSFDIKFCPMCGRKLDEEDA